MYANVPDTSIRVPSVRGGSPGVLLRSRRKDLLVLRSMKARESAQDDAREKDGRGSLAGHGTRSAEQSRAGQARPGSNVPSKSHPLPRYRAYSRRKSKSAVFFKRTSSRRHVSKYERIVMARIYNGEPRWKARSRARQSKARHKRRKEG